MRVYLVPALLFLSTQSHAKFLEYCSSTEPGLKKTIDILKIKLEESDCAKLAVKIKKVKQLDLMNSEITDIRPLNSIEKLEVLKLGYDENYVGDLKTAPKVQGFKSAKLSWIRDLDVRNQDLKSDDLRAIAISNNLVKLNLSGNNNLISLNYIQDLPNLGEFKFDCIDGYKEGAPIQCEKSNFDGDLTFLESKQWIKQFSLTQPGVTFSSCPSDYFFEYDVMKNFCAEVGKSDLEGIASAFNDRFKNGVTLCDPKKKEGESSGHVVAEVPGPNGTKEFMKVPNQTWSKFTKEGNTYVSQFEAVRRTDSGQIRKEKILLKIQPDGEQNKLTRKKNVRINLYFPDKPEGPAFASYDIVRGPERSILLTETMSQMYQLKLEKENVKDGAIFAPNVIIFKPDWPTGVQYNIDSQNYLFGPDLTEKFEEIAGRPLFTDTYNEANQQYNGNLFTTDEISSIATKLGIRPVVENNQNWRRCSPPSAEEIMKLNEEKLETPVVKYNKASEKTLENSDRSISSKETEIKGIKPRTAPTSGAKKQ